MADAQLAIKHATAWLLARKPVRAYLLYSEQRGAVFAAAVTYRALFSLFAAMLLGLSVAAVWLAGQPEVMASLMKVVDSVIPGLVGPGGLIDPENVRVRTGFSIAGVVSTLVLISGAISAIGTLRTAIRIIVGTAREEPMFVWLILRDLLCAAVVGVLFLVAALVMLSGTAFVSTVLQWLGLDGDGALVKTSTYLLSTLVTYTLDVLIIALVFRVLSGIRPSARALWSGAMLGGIGLLVLQQLSGLFIGGATSNPLLAAFASLIALLLWLNLSAQVVLIACAYIGTGVEEDEDRIHARYGATTFAQRRVHRLERDLFAVSDTLRRARKAEQAERGGDATDDDAPLS